MIPLPPPGAGAARALAVGRWGRPLRPVRRARLARGPGRRRRLRSGRARARTGPLTKLRPARLRGAGGARCPEHRPRGQNVRNSRKIPAQVPLPAGTGYIAPVGPRCPECARPVPETGDYCFACGARLEGRDPAKIGDRMVACLGMAGLTDRERIVLAAIAFHAGPAGAFPSQTRLGKMLGRHRNRIGEAVASLVGKGRLEVTRGHGNTRRTNGYVIVYGAPRQCPSCPGNGEGSQCPILQGIVCPGLQGTNRKEPASSPSRRVHEGRIFPTCASPRAGVASSPSRRRGVRA